MKMHTSVLKWSYILLVVICQEKVLANEIGEKKSDGRPEVNSSQYVDSYLSAEPQKIEAEYEKLGSYRFWTIDSTLANVGNGFKKDNISIGLKWDVENLGYWGLNTSQKTNQLNGVSETSYYRQLRVDDIPLAGDRSLSAVVGHNKLPLIRLAEKSTRFFVPSQSMDGLLVEVGDSKGMSGFISSGEVGQIGSAYGGMGFKGTGKNAISIGFELPIVRGVNTGKVGATEMSAGLQAIGVGETSKSWSLMPVLAGEKNGFKWHGQSVINMTKVDGDKNDVIKSANAFGVWGSGEYSDGPKKYEIGLFHFRPGLTWGESTLQENAEGWYSRYSVQNKRWGLNANVEQVRAISEKSTTSYAQIGSRYQIDVDTNMNAMAAVRQGLSSGWQAQTSMERKINTSTVRGQVDIGRWNEESRYQLGLDITPNLDMDLKLSSGVTMGLSKVKGVEQTWRGLGISASIDVDAMRFESSLKSTFWSDKKRSDYAQVSASWQLNDSWSIAAVASIQRGGEDKDWNLSPIAQLKTADRKSATSVWLTVRYQDSVGDSIKSGSSGDAEVIVFYDENGNGKKDAGERGVKDVAVYMEDRSIVQTNEVGQALFSGVPVGSRVFRVSQGDIPLPWQVINGGATLVNMEVRDRLKVYIPLVR
jgi:hypothetical protein